MDFVKFIITYGQFHETKEKINQNKSQYFNEI